LCIAELGDAGKIVASERLTCLAGGRQQTDKVADDYCSDANHYVEYFDTFSKLVDRLVGSFFL